jgi:hypothetical protein
MYCFDRPQSADLLGKATLAVVQLRLPVESRSPVDSSQRGA